MSLKDEPIDTVEFERLWYEMEGLWRGLQWMEDQGFKRKEQLGTQRKLREIKHRFFNQLVS